MTAKLTIPKKQTTKAKALLAAQDGEFHMAELHRQVVEHDPPADGLSAVERVRHEDIARLAVRRQLDAAMKAGEIEWLGMGRFRVVE